MKYLSFAIAVILSESSIAQPPPSFISSNISNVYSFKSALACPKFSGTPEFTLQDLTLIAICTDPGLANAIAVQNQATEDVAIAKGAYFPSLDFMSSWGKVNQTTKYDGYSESQQTRSTSSRMQATLSWLLFDSGFRASKLRDAHENLDAAIFSRQFAVRRVAFEVSRRFFLVLSKQEGFLASQQAERVAKRGQEITVARYEAGIGQHSEKLLFDNNLAEATLNKVTAEGDYAITLAELSAYALRDGSRKIRLLYPDEAELNFSDEFLVKIEKLVTDGTEFNSRVQEAQARVRAAQARVEALRAEDRPSIALILSANDDRSQPTSYLGQSVRGTSAVVQMKIPLIDGFTRNHKIRSAEALVESQQAQLKSVERDVNTTTWVALARLKSEILRAQSAQTLSSTASTLLATAQGRFAAGVGDVFEMLRAEQDASRAAQLLINSRYEYRIALLQLFMELNDTSEIKFP